LLQPIFSKSGRPSYETKASQFYAEKRLHAPLLSSCYPYKIFWMPKNSGKSAQILAALNEEITACEKCERLRTYCAQVAAVKRRAYLDCDYWGRPVPSFGDPSAEVLIVGLAPGAHGSNRTGRPFTGDGSGNFLYPTLYRTGFASQPESTARNDGMRLKGLWITSVVRCAPPGNKPLPEEMANCARFLDEEIAALENLRVIVCLGKIAFDGFTQHLLRMGRIAGRGDLQFAHGAEYKLPGEQTLLASYHPSLQNTNTGKLTEAMFLKIFRRARELTTSPHMPGI
jgi:uracil-DNA glycosylase